MVEGVILDLNNTIIYNARTSGPKEAHAYLNRVL